MQSHPVLLLEATPYARRDSELLSLNALVVQTFPTWCPERESACPSHSPYIGLLNMNGDIIMPLIIAVLVLKQLML